MQPAVGPPPPGMAAGDPLWAANRTIAGVEWNIREGACNPPSSGYSIGSGLVLRTFIRGLTLQTTLTLCLTQTPLLNNATTEVVILFGCSLAIDSAMMLYARAKDRPFTLFGLGPF